MMHFFLFMALKNTFLFIRLETKKNYGTKQRTYGSKNIFSISKQRYHSTEWSPFIVLSDWHQWNCSHSAEFYLGIKTQEHSTTYYVIFMFETVEITMSISDWWTLYLSLPVVELGIVLIFIVN